MRSRLLVPSPVELWLTDRAADALHLTGKVVARAAHAVLVTADAVVAITARMDEP